MNSLKRGVIIGAATVLLHEAVSTTWLIGMSITLGGVTGYSLSRRLKNAASQNVLLVSLFALICCAAVVLKSVLPHPSELLPCRETDLLGRGSTSALTSQRTLDDARKWLLSVRSSICPPQDSSSATKGREAW